MEIDHKLQEKLIGIYFRQAYVGFGENTQEDLDFINDNKFNVIVTEETSRNGYDSDKQKIQEYKLKLNTPYTLKSLDVGRSYSNIELEEFPGISFNFANFEVIK